MKAGTHPKGWKEPDAVQHRHRAIERLGAEGKPYKQIARLLGFKDHSAVSYHVCGHCVCKKEEA